MAEEQRPTEVPKPTPAEIWASREPEKKRGPIVAPIWIILGFSIVVAGVLFGQMFAPSSATTAESTAQTPAPAPSETPYGSATPKATWLGGTPRPHGSPQAGPTSAPSADPGPPVPSAREQIDQRYAGGAWPTASQLVSGGNESTPSTVPAVAATPAVVAVYTRDSASSQGPVNTGQIAPLPVQTPTREGDTGGRSERGGTELMRMPSEVVTPAPLTVPAGTRVSMYMNVPTDSDLSGPVDAHLAEDVCDPRTGDLAWPRGSKVTGHAVAIASSNQRHLGFAWDFLTYPNLVKQSLVDATATEDEEGHTGITGRRNTHSWSIFRDTLFGSIAGAGGQILSNLTAKVGAQAPVIVVPGQGQVAGTQSSQAPLDIPTIELGRTVRFQMVLLADFTAAGPYDEPGWHGCRS